MNFVSVFAEWCNGNKKRIREVGMDENRVGAFFYLKLRNEIEINQDDFIRNKVFYHQKII